ncbi:MAG: RNA 2',3'-cyclic phosphodiesterase [Candidatus Hadarchaeia archaeon]
MPRSFIAIDLDEEVRNNLVRVQSSLKETGGDLKIVEPENIHLTLRFLGEISRSKLRAVKDVLNEISYPTPFEIEVSSLGVFPNPSYIRVVWAGVDEGSDELVSIRKDIDNGLSQIGISPDDKDFTPHYTIARVKSGKAKERIKSLVEDHSDTAWGKYRAEKLELMESELTSEGPIYTTLETFRFE